VGRIAVLLAVLLPILVAIKIAKDRRNSCTWNVAQTRDHGAGAFFMIALALLAGFQRADALSIFSIGRALLLWYGAYRMARAIYRKRDLKNEAGASIAAAQSDGSAIPRP
jgi:hypothetical protein